VHALGLLGLSSLGVFAKRRLFFEFAQSSNDASSLSCHCQVGPARQFHPLPRAGQPQSRRHLASPHQITLRRPTSSIETPIKAPHSPALIPPLESPLTPSSAINGLGCKSPAVTHQHLHPEQPRPHYKRRAPPPEFHHTLPASLLFSPRLSIALTEHRHHRIYTAFARPPRRSSTSGEALDRTLMSSSSFPCSRGDLSWTGAPVGQAPVSSSGRRWRPVHGGPEPRWSTARGPSSRDYQFKNKSKIPLFRRFALRPLIFSKINPQSRNLQSDPEI
jgi:hypothetical protein